ncbi:MAG: hypothetical protein M3Y27_30190 [Acidobacteriota bacterium]|nr:hypothetical protein [Acidobacteriota bacterium]
MPRQMSAAMLAAIQSDSIAPALFLQATFATGPIYVWTGLGSVVWSGHTWLGIGSMGSVSVIEEGASVEARGVTLRMSGFDATLLADVLSEMKLGAPAVVYLGMFGGSPIALLADPIPAFAGRMDQPTVDASGTTASIAINVESRLLDMNVAVNRRYTNDDQQLDYPGDRGLEFVYSLIETIIYFGSKPNNMNNR